MRAFFIALALCGVSTLSIAQEPLTAASSSSGDEVLRYLPIETRLDLGFSAGPHHFLIGASAEYHIDRFLSFGPMLQWATGSNEDFWMPSLIGRLTAPLFPTKRVEFSILGGPGFIYRDLGGLTFANFDFVTGGRVDVFVIDHLTAGAGWMIHLTSSPIEKYVQAVVASCSYRF